jgi:hypothetical protein
MSNPLEPIMGSYKVTLESLGITATVLDKVIRNAMPPKHVFQAEPTGTSLDRIETAKQEVAEPGRSQPGFGLRTAHPRPSGVTTLVIDAGRNGRR